MKISKLNKHTVLKGGIILDPINNIEKDDNFDTAFQKNEEIALESAQGKPNFEKNNAKKYICMSSNESGPRVVFS